MILKVICDCITQYVKSCLYPRSIYKKRGYVDIIPLSQISKEINLISIRRSSKQLKVVDFHGVKTFLEKPIADSEIIDMSMNLLGGKWMIKHIHYADKDKKKHTDELPGFFYTVLHPKSVAYYKDAYPLYISINTINEKQFIFPIPFKNKQQREAFFKRYPVDDEKYLANDVDAKDAYEVKCEVSHKPTFLNFWHCVLNLKLDGTLLGKEPKSYKNVTAAFWETLLKTAITNASIEGIDHIIPNHLYHDK